jgi:Domain of unknown function (DUF4397)
MGQHHPPLRAPRNRPRTLAVVTSTAALTALLVMPAALSSAPRAEAATGTYVRLAQLTDTMPDTELIVSSVADPKSSVTIAGTGYGSVSAYRRVEPGDYVVAVRAKGTDKPPLVSTTLNAMVGSSYTLGAVGDKEPTGLKIFTDDVTPPAAGRAKVRVIDAAPPAPVLDVRGPGDAPFALGLAHGAASSYREVTAGSVTLTAGAPGAPAAALPITVAANQVLSVVLISSNGTIGTRVQVDAEGPKAVPPGPVDAGYGGTAGERPGALIGAGALALLAAAATGLALRLGRRTGGSRQRSC